MTEIGNYYVIVGRDGTRPMSAWSPACEWPGSVTPDSAVAQPPASDGDGGKASRNSAKAPEDWSLRTGRSDSAAIASAASTDETEY